MNTDPYQSNTNIANNSNMVNSRSANATGRRFGQAGDSYPFVAHQASVDLSAAGADERVLDCSDWDNVGDSGTRTQDVGLRTDQLNNVGIDFTLLMSPTTPAGVDGTTAPKPAGITAGKSVNPTERTNLMLDISYLGLGEVLHSSSRISLSNALTPINGFTTRGITESGLLIFNHRESIGDWTLFILTESFVASLEELGQDLKTGGFGTYAVIRFPANYAYAEQEEALAFYSSILPVKPIRILFTMGEFEAIYIQLVTGHIACIEPDVTGIYNHSNPYEAEINLFKRIIESRQVAK